MYVGETYLSWQRQQDAVKQLRRLVLVLRYISVFMQSEYLQYYIQSYMAVSGTDVDCMAKLLTSGWGICGSDRMYWR